jgi:hypothetical protein
MDGPVTNAATVVCLLGMHRSGTSLVSRVINLLGVHLGRKEAISGAGADNPKGHWEHHPIALLNDDLLIRFGGRWDVPPVFPPDWLQDADVRSIAAKARQIIDDDFGAEPLWGWKDPRTCLTAPFWQELVGPMRYVLCVRNPRAVVASLERRDGMLAAHGDRLWLRYVAASMGFTSGKPRMLLFYEDLMSDWPREVARLAAFIGQPERADDPAVRTSVAEFIEHELQHHHASPEVLASDAQMSFETKSVYLALRAHHHGDPRNLDLLAAQAVVAAEREDAFHRTHAAIVADRDAQARAIAALRSELN